MPEPIPNGGVSSSDHRLKSVGRKENKFRDENATAENTTDEVSPFSEDDKLL